jgi:CoA:oxalate CoA-transferase
MVLDVDHGQHGVIRMVGFPVKMSGTPCSIRHPAPRLGEHSVEVLTELGLSEAEVVALQSAKVVA